MWNSPRLSGGKKLTFLYVPDNASVRQFMVPKFLFHALGAAALVGLGLIGFIGSRYLSALAEGRRLSSLRGENLQMRDELADLKEQAADLRVSVQASIALTQEVRSMANLGDLHPEVLQAGTGGPAPTFESTESISPELRADLESVRRELTQLLAQARMQRDGYMEAITVLKSNQSVWDHTPSVGPLAVSIGRLTGRFGRRMDPFTGQSAAHRGADFAAHPGTPIRATAEGVVTSTTRVGGYGLLVEIDHGNGILTRYAHCSAVTVKPGEHVRRGTQIARVGSSGRATGSHVHYEVVKNGLHFDPIAFVLPTDVVVD